MAIFGGKDRDDLLRDNARYEAEVTMLREQVTYLRDMLNKTQTALIAKESPEAYIDMKIEEEKAEQGSELAAQRERAKKQAAMDNMLLDRIEQPLFKDAEEMQALLMQPTMHDIFKSESTHNDGES